MTRANLPFSQQATIERTGSCLKMYILRTSHFLTAGLKWKRRERQTNIPNARLIFRLRGPRLLFSLFLFSPMPHGLNLVVCLFLCSRLYIYVLELNSQSRSHQNNSERFAVILMQSETLSSASSGCEIRPNYRHSVFTHTVFPFPSK